MMKVIPQCAIQMTVYDGMKDILLRQSGGQELTNPQRLVAGHIPCHIHVFCPVRGS